MLFLPRHSLYQFLSKEQTQGRALRKSGRRGPRAFCKSNYRLVPGIRGATTSFACWRSRLSPALTPPSADLGTRASRCRRPWPSDILGLRGPRTAPPGVRRGPERRPRCCAQDMVAPLESTLIFAKCSRGEGRSGRDSRAWAQRQIRGMSRTEHAHGKGMVEPVVGRMNG